MLCVGQREGMVLMWKVMDLGRGRRERKKEKKEREMEGERNGGGLGDWVTG